MSAQLSSTASKNLSPDKNALTLPSFLRDSDSDFAKQDQSADQGNGRGTAAPAGERSNLSSHLPPLRLLVVDESSQVRRMCCEVAGSFGFVGTEAKTISSA